MSLRCEHCGGGLVLDVSWASPFSNTLGVLDVRCSSTPVCQATHWDGLWSLPPWAAEDPARTSIHTAKGRRIVKIPPRPPTEKEIDQDRGVMDAHLRSDGWVQCPHCGVRFASYSLDSWRDGRHVSCRTRLRLITPA